MAPQLFTIGPFVQLGDADTVPVRRNMLCLDIHGHFRQIQVCSDSRRRRNACLIQYVPDHPGGKLAGAPYRVYTILGDGEIQEGQVWEAAMFAAAKGLDNLVAVVDNNNLQIDGTVSSVNSPYPIPEKFKAFGWNVIEICGHNFDEIDAAFNAAKGFKGKPTAIIAKTTKGKGVSFMEDNCDWHGKAPNQEEYNTAMAELDAELAQLEAM